ncbi:MAG: ferrochelatase [Anaerolineales bacterium]|nr:ferrochelatase [Anaerolineales bacterium]
MNRAAIQTHFEPSKFRFYSGMRHWSPWIEDTIREMLEDGITHAISLVLAPHYSKLSIAKYHAKITTGLEMYRGHIEFARVESY